MRTIVDIPDEILTNLGEVSKREHISRAEAIRRAVAQYLRALPAAGAADQAFGIWKRRKTTGLEYEDKVRRDWQHCESPR